MSSFILRLFFDTVTDRAKCQPAYRLRLNVTPGKSPRGKRHGDRQGERANPRCCYREADFHSAVARQEAGRRRTDSIAAKSSLPRGRLPLRRSSTAVGGRRQGLVAFYFLPIFQMHISLAVDLLTAALTPFNAVGCF